MELSILTFLLFFDVSTVSTFLLLTKVVQFLYDSHDGNGECSLVVRDICWKGMSLLSGCPIFVLAMMAGCAEQHADSDMVYNP